MPNRIIRDWTDSERIDTISFQAEVLLLRLMMKADDLGAYHANPKLINSFCFPLKNIRETDISRWLQELVSSGLIALYAADNKSFLHIINFGQRLRTVKPKYPKIPDNVLNKIVTATCQQIDDRSPLEEEVETEEEVEVEYPYNPQGNLSDQKKLFECYSDKNTEECHSKKVAPKKVFTTPSSEEVQSYCNERQNGITGDEFVNFYQSKGWMVGKNKMKDWQAAIRTWENSRKNNGQSNNNSTNAGFSNQKGNSNGSSKVSGKVSASSILARQAREQFTRNGESGDTTIEVEVVG